MGGVIDNELNTSGHFIYNDKMIKLSFPCVILRYIECGTKVEIEYDTFLKHFKLETDIIDDEGNKIDMIVTSLGVINVEKHTASVRHRDDLTHEIAMNAISNMFNILSSLSDSCMSEDVDSETEYSSMCKTLHLDNCRRKVITNKMSWFFMYLTEEQDRELYELYQKKIVPLGEFELKAYNRYLSIKKKEDVICKDKFIIITKNKDIMISVVIDIGDDHKLAICVDKISGMNVTEVTTYNRTGIVNRKIHFIVDSVVDYDGYIYDLIKSCILYTTDEIHKCIASQIDVDNIKSLIDSLKDNEDI